MKTAQETRSTFIKTKLQELFPNENQDLVNDKWDSLWDDLGDLEQPRISKTSETNASINIPDALFSDSDLRTILKNRGQLSDEELPLYSEYFRVFVDPEHNGKEIDEINEIKGGLRNLEKEKIRNNPPGEQEDIEDYLIRIFGTSPNQHGKQVLNRCGIIILTGNKFNRNIPDKFRIVYEQLMLKLNVDSDKGEFLELDSTVFMGNYGYTALGVHQDRDLVDHIIHFHRGPGTKIMHLWGEEEYKELVGIGDSRFFGKNDKHGRYTSISSFIEHSEERAVWTEPVSEWEEMPFRYKEFEVNAGDVFVLPCKDKSSYHLGKTPNFSVGVTLLVTKWNKSDLETWRKAFRLYLNEKEKIDRRRPLLNAYTGATLRAEITDVLQTSSDYLNAAREPSGKNGSDEFIRIAEKKDHSLNRLRLALNNPELNSTEKALKESLRKAENTGKLKTTSDLYGSDDGTFSVNSVKIIDFYVKKLTDNYGFEPFDSRLDQRQID